MSQILPESINDWTFETVNNLVSLNYIETDKFDFKEILVNKNDPKHNLRISKTSAAFANSRGGFLIFGIKDWQEKLNPKERIVGIDFCSEIAQYFGNAIRSIEPSIAYIPSNPPISIPSSDKVILIVKIPISIKGPHGVKENNQYIFYKRTNQGNEPMNYNEIQLIFLDRHERDRKLRLLFRTLADYLFAIQRLKFPAPMVNGSVLMNLEELNIGILDVLVSDLYVLLPEANGELWANLRNLRQHAQAINELMKLFRIRYYSGILNAEKIISDHNKQIDKLIPGFVQLNETIMSELGKYGDIGGVIP
ncbi:MAG: ATP-binding protein [Dehalococcoidales bacterium]|nr:ATP-binding protein [Dehalococcoidales bacterium]